MEQVLVGVSTALLTTGLIAGLFLAPMHNQLSDQIQETNQICGGDRND